jgi:twitching motility protein PilT
MVRSIKIDALNLPQYHTNALSALGSRRGLVIVAGGPNQGKTTTAASVFTRWVENGGIGVTLEDPPEIPIDGQHGKGVCFQIPVQNGAWANALKQSLRFGSRYLFMGETRDGDAAREMARAALSNQSVLSTIHADTVHGAANVLLHHCRGDSQAIDNLASGLKAIIVQELESHEGRMRPRISQALYVSNENKAGVESAIKSGDANALRSLVELQEAALAARFSKPKPA